MKHTYKRVSRLIIISLLIVLMVSINSLSYGKSVETKDIETSKYNVSVLVNKNHSYYITKNLTIKFNENKRYFDINIPNERMKIEDIDVEGAEFFTTENNDYITVRIASEEGELTGTRDIKLTYTVYEYADELTSMDLFYLELLPHDWPSGVDNIVVGVVFPKDFPIDDLKYFADQYGAALGNENLDVKIIEEEYKMVFTGSDLQRGVGLSIKAELPQGYWVGEINNNWAKNYVYYVLISLMGLLAIMWYFFGKDPQINITEEYYPPDAMTPPEIGYILDGHVGKKDIVALLFYLADRRQIKIVEYGRKQFKIIKNREPKTEKRYVRQAVSAMFDRNTEVNVSEIRKNLSKAYGRVKRGIEDQFEASDKRIYTPASEFAKVFGCFILSAAILAIGILSEIYAFGSYSYIFYIIMTILVFITSLLTATEYDKVVLSRNTRPTVLMGIFASALFIVLLVFAIFVIRSFGDFFIGTTMILCLVVSMILICLMKARTKKNAEILGRVLGFRNFIRKPNMEIVLQLSRENPLYFYDILPYAYTFGLTPVWTKSFDIVMVEEPEWFEPFMHFEQRKYSLGINTLRFNTILNDFSRNFADNIDINDEL